MTDTTVHGSLNRTLAILLVLAVSGALIASFLGTYLAGIVVVLILAYAKACFVILDFMEMRGTRGALRPRFSPGRRSCSPLRLRVLSQSACWAEPTACIFAYSQRRVLRDR